MISLPSFPDSERFTPAEREHVIAELDHFLDHLEAMARTGANSHGGAGIPLLPVVLGPLFAKARQEARAKPEATVWGIMALHDILCVALTRISDITEREMLGVDVQEDTQDDGDHGDLGIPR